MMKKRILILDYLVVLQQKQQYTGKKSNRQSLVEKLLMNPPETKL